MNIKNFFNASIFSGNVKIKESSNIKERSIKSENTDQRDANGQEYYSKQKKTKKMTKEQFKKALEILNEKPFMKEMKWKTIEHLEDGFFFVEVISEDNTVIRRMSEFDLWEVFNKKSIEENKGQLLKKSA